MSPAVMDRLAARIAEHAWRHHPPEIRVTLHGGEPLLAGQRAIGRFAQSLRDAWTGLDTELRLSVQTNGSLIDRDYLELFRRFDIQVGVSLDGTRASHDRRRRYHSGRASHADVSRALELLRLPRYRRLYGGLLCVVDLEADPVETYEAMLDHEPPLIDLLIPHGTWEFPPLGLPSHEGTPYARWLSAAFDRWFDAPVQDVPVRLFDSLVDLYLGLGSTSEMWGPYGSDTVVIQPDGAIEQNDILKSVHDRAAGTGFHVDSDDFNKAAGHPGFAAERAGYQGLCHRCRECPVVAVCGGGLRAHRYRPANEFDNPSCYCADLRSLIDHVCLRTTEKIMILGRQFSTKWTTPLPSRTTETGEVIACRE